MSEAKLVRRSQRVAFYGIPVSGGGEISTYNRMEHFTSLTEGKIRLLTKDSMLIRTVRTVMSQDTGQH